MPDIKQDRNNADHEHGELIENHLDYKWWYKKDGTRTASKLPCDPYHVARFTERGWTMTPPTNFLEEEEKDNA